MRNWIWEINQLLNSNHQIQIPNKFHLIISESPKFSMYLVIEKFGHYLVIGIWDLELHVILYHLFNRQRLCANQLLNRTNEGGHNDASANRFPQRRPRGWAI